MKSFNLKLLYLSVLLLCLACSKTDENTPAAQKPQKPENLRADVISDNQINLYWADKSNDEVGFQIERSANNNFNNPQLTIDLKPNTTTFTDKQLEGDTVLYYRIKAIGHSQTSDETVTSVTIPKKSYSLSSSRQTYGNKSAGMIPLQVTNQMHLGLFENRGLSWMKNSGVSWNARYMYLTKGWANNWGWGNYDGEFAFSFMKECEEMNALPVLEFYLQTHLGGGGENNFYKNTTDPNIMKDLFGQFKLLLSRAKEYNKPVAILIEADGSAFLQIQCNSNPNAYAAIADSNMPELANLPNTVAGWGLAFLELKEKMGCHNVAIGMHISAWASGSDIAIQPEVELETEVEKVFNFLKPLGLAANQTGIEYDFLVGDPLDRDADYYRIVRNSNRWWDMNGNADINTISFNRYAEWLRIWNKKSNKRWMLWQIPLGNKYHLNTYNNGNPQQGYKDNRVEYFLDKNHLVHLAKFADSGVFALLFGMGQPGQANYLNDFDGAGNLYMKTRANAFFNNGGMPLKRAN